LEDLENISCKFYHDIVSDMLVKCIRQGFYLLLVVGLPAVVGEVDGDDPVPDVPKMKKAH
jgi:hypothetical protein